MLSIMAHAAQKAPATTSRNDRKTQIREVPSREPIKKVTPKIIRKSPTMNTNLAVNLRENLFIILKI